MMARPLSYTGAVGAQRIRDLALIGGFLVWLVYTRMYFLLQAAHLTAPPCPFFYLTGHPCPFCGGTRSFAYMWGGDIADAVRLYPLGPLMFARTIATVGGLAARAITWRTWMPLLTSAQWRAVAVGAVSALLFSWALYAVMLRT